MLQVDILDLKFRLDWGFVAILPLLGTLPDEFTEYETIHADIDTARGVCRAALGHGAAPRPVLRHPGHGPARRLGARRHAGAARPSAATWTTRS